MTFEELKRATELASQYYALRDRLRIALSADDKSGQFEIVMNRSYDREDMAVEISKDQTIEAIRFLMNGVSQQLYKLGVYAPVEAAT